MRAALYVRISHDPKGEGLGVARQQADCQKLADARGWDVVEVYRDNDQSAYSGKPRPAYGRMCDDIKNRQVQAVVVWHPDRLHRSPRELEDFIDLIEDTGCRVVSVTAGDYDLDTPEGRLVARITGSVARKESEDRARRVARKHREKAEQGLPAGGGVRAFGYARDGLTIVPGEAALIREAARRVLDGEGVSTIATDWNRRGETTVRGNRWNRTTIRDFLTAGRVAGKRTHHGKVVADAVWEPILDEVTWLRLRRLLLDPDRRRTHPRKHPLSGTIVCGRCGRGMIGMQVYDAHTYVYACRVATHPDACGRISIRKDPTENHVVDAIVAVLDRPMLAPDHTEVDEARREIEQLEERLTGLARDHYADGIIDRAEYLAARDVLQSRLAAARARAVPTGAPTVTAREVRDGWWGWPLGKQRALLEQLIDRIVIAPARPGATSVSTDRITIEWRV